MLKMNYDYTESGFCRVHYKYKNYRGEWVNYCLMEDIDGSINMYSCSIDSEPDCIIELSKTKFDLEIPPDEYGKKLYYDYFNDKGTK